MFFRTGKIIILCDVRFKIRKVLKYQSKKKSPREVS